MFFLHGLWMLLEKITNKNFTAAKILSNDRKLAIENNKWKWNQVPHDMVHFHQIHKKSTTFFYCCFGFEMLQTHRKTLSNWSKKSIKKDCESCVLILKYALLTLLQYSSKTLVINIKIFRDFAYAFHPNSFTGDVTISTPLLTTYLQICTSSFTQFQNLNTVVFKNYLVE